MRILFDEYHVTIVTGAVRMRAYSQGIKGTSAAGQPSVRSSSNTHSFDLLFEALVANIPYQVFSLSWDHASRTDSCRIRCLPVSIFVLYMFLFLCLFFFIFPCIVFNLVCFLVRCSLAPSLLTSLLSFKGSLNPCL